MLDYLKGRRLYLLCGVVIFGLTFVGTYSGRIPVPEVSVEWKDPANEKSYTPSYNVETGREWAFVYIGSSECAVSNRAFLPEAIKKLKRLVQEEARARGRSFAATGVAKDWNAKAGIEHLEKFGPFDEVMAGRNWLNVGALKYVWEDIPGRAATPQVLVISRSIRTPERKKISYYSIRDEVLLTRKVGTREIRQWLERGAPLPTLEAPAEAPSASTAQAAE